MDDLGVFTLTLPPSDDGPDDSTPDDDAPPMLRILTSDQATEDEEQADADTVLRDAADAAQQEREAWLGGWTGGNIWESSEVLARLLCLRPQSWWAGKRVVELGAGCGLVGLTALALGAAEVTLTDQVLYMARQNTISNFGVESLEDHDWQQRSTTPDAAAEALLQAKRAAAAAAAATGGESEAPPLHAKGTAVLRNLYWGDATDIADASPPFDLLLGSDLMYHSSDLSALADTIAGLTTPGSEVLWASPDAALEDRFGSGFYDRLREHDFELTDLSDSEDVTEARELVVPTYEYSGRGPVRVIRMVRCEPGGVTVDGDSSAKASGKADKGVGEGGSRRRRRSKARSQSAAVSKVSSCVVARL